jgi:hypothetical protein
MRVGHATACGHLQLGSGVFLYELIPSDDPSGKLYGVFEKQISFRQHFFIIYIIFSNNHFSDFPKNKLIS